MNVSGQQAKLSGIVTNENDQPVEAVNVTIPFTSTGTITNSQGYFELMVPANSRVEISMRYLGYQPVDTSFLLKDGEHKNINVKLEININEIQEVWISSSINRGNNLTRIEIKDFNVLPNATGNIETLLKTMPGVSSNNELSSQYSVRGGNFDENLVYVNGVQIYRPFLIRSGQQEGLSFVNPDMIRTIDFSAGGFEAKYGDKMSSVLDIKYRVPQKNSGSVSASLLGGSAHIEGVALNKKLRYLNGFRFKTTRYLLNTLDISGNYEPKFYDFQSCISYDVNSRLQFSFLGNFASNVYLLKPDLRDTDFGTFNTALNLRVYYEGQEIDKFTTFTGAFTTLFQPNTHHSFKLIFSSFSTREMESYDIGGYYSINQLDTRVGSSSFGDSLYSLGYAGTHEHARNYLEAQVFTVSFTGLHEQGNNKVEWGIRIQNERIEDEINEWDILDSAGYFIPYTGRMVSTNNRVAGSHNISNMRYEAFLQNTKKYFYLNGNWHISYGIRSSIWEFNKQLLFSPRFSIAYIPEWNKNLSFFASTGYYYQPPFYKEFRDREGNLNQYILAQKSVHYILGSDYLFSAWNRPFKLTSEIYYKQLDNLIPYKIDNIRIQYSAKNNSHGYAAGIEFKVSGEFVKNAQSWASLSFLSTKEDITGDFYQDGQEKKYPGYFPRPTNQLINFATFFQDYFPNNPEYKFHLTFFYGSRLPVSNPLAERYDQNFSMPAYLRLDVGLSKSIVKLTSANLFKSVWLNLEVLNIFGFENVASYDWIRTISSMNGISGQFAVKNVLTGRRVNAKLTLNF